MAALLSYAFLVRIDPLVQNPDAINPDAHRHFQAAQEIDLWNPVTWLAVPRGYFPFALWNRVLFTLSSFDPQVQRFGTVLLSVLAVFQVGSLAKRRSGPLFGLLAAFLLATSPPLIESASKGIRTESILCLWLLLFGLATSRLRGDRLATRSFLFGLTAGLLFFVRVDGIVAIAGFAALVLVETRGWRDWRSWGPGAGAFILLLGLVALSNAIRFGNPLEFLDTQKEIFRYWANTEFAGQPGFPAQEALATDSRSGDHLSGTEYFGEILGPWGTLSRFYRGYRSFFLGNFGTGVYDFTGFPQHIGWVGLWTSAGVAVALWRKRLSLLGLIPLLLVNTAWTYHNPGHDFRFFYPVIPFAILLTVEALSSLASWLRARGPSPVLHALVPAFALLMILNPWNHDREVSFPWTAGFVGTTPDSARKEPVSFGEGLRLEGWEIRKPWLLGIRTSPVERAEAGTRLRVSLYWNQLEPAKEPQSYTFRIVHDEIGSFGTVYERPLFRRIAASNVSDGRTLLETFDYLIYPRVPPGQCRVEMKVDRGGAETSDWVNLGAFEVLPYGWHFFDGRNWG